MESSNLFTIQINLGTLMDKGFKIWGVFWQFFAPRSFDLKKRMKNLAKNVLISIKCQYVSTKIWHANTLLPTKNKC